MRIINRIVLLVAIILMITVPAKCQTPTPIPITGNLGSIAGTPEPDAYAQITLMNCSGGTPQISGFHGIVRTTYQFTADTNGNINGTIWPNDLIDCAGTTGDTVYSMQLVGSDDVPIGQSTCYQIVHTQGAWNINSQQPVSCQGTPPNPQDVTYNSVVVNQNLTANTGVFAGSIKANGGVQLPVAQACTGSGLMTGYTTTLAPVCITLAADVASFNGRTGVVVPQSGDYSYGMITGTPTLHYQTAYSPIGTALAQESRFELGVGLVGTDDPTNSATKIDLPTIAGGAGTCTNCNITYNAYGIPTAYTTGASAANIFPFHFTGCNPGASANISHCAGTETLTAAVPAFTPTDANYVLSCTPYTTGGADTFITITSQTTSAFNYDVAVMMVNGTTTQPTTANCFVSNHP